MLMNVAQGAAIMNVTAFLDCLVAMVTQFVQLAMVGVQVLKKACLTPFKLEVKD
jgi:hypothetical protein